MNSIITNIIIIFVILLIIGFAIIYIFKAKKQGQKCIGCPYSKTCSKHHNCSCDNNQ